MPTKSTDPTIMRVERYRIVAAVAVVIWAVIFLGFVPTVLASPPGSEPIWLVARVMLGASVVLVVSLSVRALVWLKRVRVVTIPTVTGSRIVLRADSPEVCLGPQDISRVRFVDDAVILGGGRVFAAPSRGKAVVMNVKTHTERPYALFAVGAGAEEFANEVEGLGVSVDRDPRSL